MRFISSARNLALTIKRCDLCGASNPIGIRYKLNYFTDRFEKMIVCIRDCEMFGKLSSD